MKSSCPAVALKTAMLPVSPASLSLTSSLFRGLGINIPDGLTKGLKPLFTKLETALPDAVQGAMMGGQLRVWSTAPAWL
jgi:hypothetical protein